MTLGNSFYGVPMPSGNISPRYRPTGVRGTVPHQSRQTKNTYATLLYTDDFLLGVRVLGQSIRESGTTTDMVALLTKNVSRSAEETLRGDGWITERIDMIANPATRPDGSFPRNFFGVYSKLLMWGLTDYEKVLYLDADTIVVRNIDHLFGCPGLCVVVRHSERFNSGLMVLTPDAAVLDDMLDQIESTPSYTGGDQGFLNVYFSEFIDSPMFDPDADQSGHRVLRLETG